MATACGGGGGSAAPTAVAPSERVASESASAAAASTATLPTNPDLRIAQMRELLKQGRFHVIFDLSEPKVGQFSWMQGPAGRRWDELSLARGRLVGIMNLEMGGNRGQSCGWSVERSGSAHVGCQGHGGVSFYRQSLLDILTGISATYVQFVGSRSIVGEDADCFDPTAPGLSGEICVSPDGIPLVVNLSQAHVSAPTETYSLTAIQILPPPEDAAFEQSIIPSLVEDPNAGFGNMDLDWSAMNVPRMPIVEQFLGSQ